VGPDRGQEDRRRGSGDEGGEGAMFDQPPEAGQEGGS
jgi:hypothetical protein